MAARVPFIGQAYHSQSSDVDCERTVNFYPEQVESGSGKSSVVLYPSPGFSLFTTLPQSNVRGMLYHDSRLFAVAGTGFYEITSTGVVTLRGTVATGTDPASIVANGDGGGQLFITSGGNGYCFVLATNVLTTELTGTADFGGFLDGYFLALDAATSTLQISNLLDGTTWGALDIAQRVTGADPWVSMLVSDRQIFLYGTKTSEAWYNSGNPDFPFEPVQGSFVQDGIAAPYSTAALVDNTRIWLAANADGSNVVKRASGYVPERISTHAIEHAIQGYLVTSDGIGWTYQEEGHTFFVLSFPTARGTWVYDTVTGLWHERGWWDTLQMRYEASRARCHAYAFDQHLVGDRLSGGIYQQSITSYQDIGGTELRRVRQGPHLHQNGAWVDYPEVTLLMESGVATGTEDDPQVMLQWSDDGGHTWSNEHWVTAGAVGVYGKDAVWRRCGRSKDRVFRVTCSDAVPYRLFGMEVGA